LLELVSHEKSPLVIFYYVQQWRCLGWLFRFCFCNPNRFAAERKEDNPLNTALLKKRRWAFHYNKDQKPNGFFMGYLFGVKKTEMR
jgi:hypothetical protein